MEHSSSWEANRPSGRPKTPAFRGTPRFITAFAQARHLSLFWGTKIHFPTDSFKTHFTITLPSMPRSSKCCLPLRYPHQNPIHFSSPHTFHMPHPSNSFWFGQPDNILKTKINWNTCYWKIFRHYFEPRGLQRGMRQCTDHGYWISRDLTYSELLSWYMYPDTEVNYRQYRASFELGTCRLRRPAG